MPVRLRGTRNREFSPRVTERYIFRKVPVNVTFVTAVVSRICLCVIGPPDFLRQDVGRHLPSSPSVRRVRLLENLDVSIEIQVLTVRAIVLRLLKVYRDPGTLTIRPVLITVTLGASVQLVSGHPRLAVLLAIIVNGAILEFALEAAAIVTTPVPMFTPGNPQTCPWTLTKCSVSLLKRALGRLHTIYTTPVVLTGELLFSVTTMLGPKEPVSLVFP